MSPPRSIALIGLRASGKSTVGRALATALAMPFIDLDDEIVRTHATSTSIGALFAALGQEGFREHESQVLERVLSRPTIHVIATGGGVIERETNRRLLEARAIPVWLQVSVVELQRRMRADPIARPPLLGRDAVLEVPEIAARRTALYALVAALVVDASGGPAEEVAARIAFHLAGAGFLPRSEEIPPAC